jgi:hypothetical protein
MRRHIFRIFVATLAFSLGILCASLWFVFQVKKQEKKKQTETEKSIPSDTFITLERTPCYGNCPRYTLAITSDGTVIFGGFYFVKDNNNGGWKRSDVIKSHITQEQVRQLITEFEKTNYFSLQDSYGIAKDGCPSVRTDNPSAFTSIRLNGRKKSIYHYLGCRYSDDHDNSSYPKELTTLENRIDEIVNTKQWMK